MAISIVEKVLGTNDPYTSNYIHDTLRLARSMTIKTALEAETYNMLVLGKYGIVVDEYLPETWRYYKHLAGEYHEVDVPMEVISRDNRKPIILTRETLQSHIETREELYKFGAFYEEVLGRYPEQLILLKSMMASNELPSINDIIYKTKEWEIVGYNANLIEAQETNVLKLLQERIWNHSVTGLIAHYRHTDNLYLGTMLCRLAGFVFGNLFTLRLKNTKSGKVHSYHMLNYFASHHGIDKAYDNLDHHQRLKLYMNLLYYNSHAGKNEVFEELVDLLMTRKRITVVNYVYRQRNQLRGNLLTDYAYYQHLLNKKPFVYDTSPYDYARLRDKEIEILNKNRKHYDFNGEDIDFNMTNSLTTAVKTKDLEMNLQDDTNNVEYKLIDCLFDYWAATTQLGYNNALVEIVDPVSGKNLELVAKDAFKLFSITLHFSLNIKIDKIPDYWCWNVIKETLPTEKEMLSKVSDPTYHMTDEVIDLRNKTPSYHNTDTNRAFRAFVEKVYRYELAAWIYQGSTGNLDAKTNYMEAYETLHTKLLCHFDDEDVRLFLVRIGLPDLLDYTADQAGDLLNLIIRMSTEDILELAEINRLTQEAATYVIQKFNSYTTQLLSLYRSNDVVLIGIQSPRVGFTNCEDESTHPIDIPKEILCMKHDYMEEFELHDDQQITQTHEVEASFFIVDTTKTILLTDDTVEGIVDNTFEICGRMEVTPHVEITRDLILQTLNEKDNETWIHVP